MEKTMEYKLLIESDGGIKCHVEVEGTRISIMNGLANLSRNLLKDTNLTKKDIIQAVELGLKTDEELKAETDKLAEGILEKLEKLMKSLNEN